MKLLLNDKEIARFLIELIDVRDSCKKIELNEEYAAAAITWIIDKKSQKKFSIEKLRDKIKQKIRHAVSKDMRVYMSAINAKITNHHDFYYKNIHTHIEYFIKTLGEDGIISAYKSHQKKNFIKTVGFQIDPDAVMMLRINFNSVELNQVQDFKFEVPEHYEQVIEGKKINKN
jgi:NAD kinase